MSRWTSLGVGALALTLSACSDRIHPVVPTGDAALLLNEPLTAAIDPALAARLATTPPTERLEVIAAFNDTTHSAADVNQAILSTGAGVITFRHLPMTVALATPSQVDAISRVPGVRSVYVNKPIEFTLRESVASIKADQVWADYGVTGAGVGVAILDSGIDGLYHPGLAFPTKTVANVKVLGSVKDLVTYGDDSCSPTCTPKPAATLWVEDVANTETASGHGTHVAGIAAGSGAGSSAGIYTGVAPGAHLIGVGVGNTAEIIWVLAGMDYIAEHAKQYNIKVVNNSWGIPGGSEYDPNDPTNMAVKRLHDLGILSVFAAGNDGPTENTLSGYAANPVVVGVAAGCKINIPFDPTNSAARCADARGLDRAPVLAQFSSRGSASDKSRRPDITAPGVRIVSARASNGIYTASGINNDVRFCNNSIQNVDHYTCLSGTSMAAPHVAGVAALMWEAARKQGHDLKPWHVLQMLKESADKLPGYEEWEVGAGFLNAKRAVELARQRYPAVAKK